MELAEYKIQHAQEISIHAPTRGATHGVMAGAAQVEDFNSRPYARGDKVCLCQRTVLLYFNSRPYARGDAGYKAKGKAGQIKFQFTPLREGRLSAMDVPAIPCKFQFTPLREGRPVYALALDFQPRFQFTPLREGRRASSAYSYLGRPQFQFTPLREGRR